MSNKISHHTQTNHSTQNYTLNKGHITHNEYNTHTHTHTQIKVISVTVVSAMQVTSRWYKIMIFCYIKLDTLNIAQLLFSPTTRMFKLQQIVHPFLRRFIRSRYQTEPVHTRPVQKVSDLVSRWLQYLIPFKVGPL
jgi:hypothetical protein